MIIDFKTLLIGIITISIGQIIIKLVIEPVHQFKEAVSDLQFWILETSPQYNGHLIPENAIELRKIATKILAEMNTIPFYWIMSILFNLPRKNKVIKASRYILGLSYSLNQLEMLKANQSRVEQICKMMKIYNSWNTNLDLLNIGSEL